jgi:hypothetical protein
MRARAEMVRRGVPEHLPGASPRGSGPRYGQTMGRSGLSQAAPLTGSVGARPMKTQDAQNRNRSGGLSRHPGNICRHLLPNRPVRQVGANQKAGPNPTISGVIHSLDPSHG